MWSLMQEKQRLEGLNQAEEALRKDYTGEIVEWIELTERMSEELARVKADLAEAHGLKEVNAKLRRENEALTDLLTRTAGKGGSGT